MPRLFMISVCHMKPEIISYSLVRYYMTRGETPHLMEMVLVDNLWPLQPELTQRVIGSLAVMFNATVFRADVNEGGHGGFTRGLNYLNEKWNLADDDLILGYDPDSNPLTQGWIQAMMEVLNADPEMNFISLMHEHILERKWTHEDIAGHHVVSLPHPEMMNVTMWKWKAVKDGLKALKPFYGFVEVAMQNKGKHGYLYDFRETLCPIPHEPQYTEWKGQHVAGLYAGNFDEWVKRDEVNAQ